MSKTTYKVARWFFSTRLVRWFMQALIAALFRVAFAPLVRATKGIIGPYLRSYTLDKAQLKIVMGMVADRLQGFAVSYAVMGAYTAAEQQDIVDGLTDIIRAMLTDYQVTVPVADLGRLLEAVADTIVVPVVP